MVAFAPQIVRGEVLSMRLFALVSLAVSVLVLGSAARAAAQEDAKPAPAQQSSQQVAQQPSQPLSQPAAQQPAAAEPDKSKIVYVSDFELDAVDANGELAKSVPAIPPSSAPQIDPRREQGPVEQAGRLVDFMSTVLVKELERAGYTAHRLRPGETRPTDGVRISGIFGEPDEQNRLRRAVMGTITPPDGKMSLFVGIGNLARPDQALYAAANPTIGESKAGTVITVSAYAPVAKFEVEKNTTEKAVKDTAANIVADLGALLNANYVALTQ
jgi:hypothetical protein